MNEAKRKREYRKEKMKDEKWVEEERERRKARYYEKKKSDPEFFNRKMKVWRDKKIKKDPSWSAKRQKEFRINYPDKFNYMMARFYLKKLSAEKIKQLVKEVEEWKAQKPE